MTTASQRQATSDDPVPLWGDVVVGRNNLVEYLQAHGSHFECMIWNGCKTGGLACALTAKRGRSQPIGASIGWSTLVHDEAACKFGAQLHFHLARGATYTEAFEKARTVLPVDAGISAGNLPFLEQIAG